MEIEPVPTSSDMENSIDTKNIIHEIEADMDIDESGLKLEDKVKIEASSNSSDRPISENNSNDNWNTNSGQSCHEPSDFFEVREIKVMDTDSMIDHSTGSKREKRNISPLKKHSNIRKRQLRYPVRSNLKNIVKSNRKQIKDMHFKCTFCSVVFSQQEALKLHYIIDHPDQKINARTLIYQKTKCLICNKICKTESSLKSHLNVHLQGEEPYKCVICSKIFLSKLKFKFHLNDHHGCKSCIKCSICSVEFESKRAQAAHYREHHRSILSTYTEQKPKPYIYSADNNYVAKCKFCRYICYSLSMVKKHLKTHVVPPFVCKICSREFNVKTAFARHINFEQRKDSDDIVKKCEFCLQRFFNATSLSRHINICHKNDKIVNADLKCNSPEIFATETTLRTPVTNSHRGDPNIRENNIEGPKIEGLVNNKDLKCNSCSEIFATETALRTHVMNCHRTVSDIRENNIDSPNSSRENGKDLKFDDKKSKENKYKCDHCARTFFYEDVYETHAKTHIFVKCKLCESEFGISYTKTMENHMDTHIKEKPYTCQICSREFGYRRDLKIHLVAEAKEIKENFYKCDICHLHYYYRTCLSKHLVNKHRPYVIDISNAKEKVSYKCEKCEREFKDEPKLQRHLATHEYSETCLVCKVTFDNPTEFRSHFRQHAEQMNKCPMCSMRITSTDKLRRHMLLEQRRLTKPPLFTCSICNRGFQRESPLRNHKKMFHAKRPITEDEAAFKCFYCGKLFIQVVSYQSHMKRHNFFGYCKICYASFTSRARLYKHLDEHLGQKPFTCAICNRIFDIKKTLRNHLKQEQLKYSHKMVMKCEFCGVHYFHRSSFNKHVLEHRFDIQEIMVEPEEVMVEPEDTKYFDYPIETEPADLDIKDEIPDVSNEGISNVRNISDVLTKEEMPITSIKEEMPIISIKEEMPISIKEEMLDINIKVDNEEYVTN